MRITIGAFLLFFTGLFAIHQWVSDRHDLNNYPKLAPHATYRVQTPVSPQGPGQDMNLNENKALKDTIAEINRVLPVKTDSYKLLSTGYSKRPGRLIFTDPTDKLAVFGRTLNPCVPPFCGEKARTQ